MVVIESEGEEEAPLADGEEDVDEEDEEGCDDACCNHSAEGGCAMAKPPGGRPQPSSPDERFREGLEQKEKGNEAYKDGKYEAAIDSWCMARGTMKHILERGLFNDDEAKLKEVKATLLSIHLNLAQGSLKNGEFYQAAQHCGRALELDPRSTKALYRKASGELMGSLFAEARQTLQAFLEIEPDNPGALQMMQEVQRKEKLAAKSGKKAALRMLSGMDRDPRVELSWREELRRRLSSCCRRRKSD